MFDEFKRELKRLGLERGVSIPIQIPLDDKAYFDRKCPHRECGTHFKVMFDDWRDKVPNHAAFCPRCGERANPTEFNTEWQQDYIGQVGKAYVAKELNQAFSRAARRTRPLHVSAGLFNMTMSVTYKAGPTPVVLPPAANEELRQDFTCEACGCRYSTLGAGYFCPACGHNSPVKDFEHTIEMTRKTVDGMDRIKEAVSEMHDKDVAENLEQQLLEDQIENLVTAFQRVSESLFRALPSAGAFTWDANLFQRLADASDLWKRATGDGYDKFLSADELAVLHTMIQRRHKLGHCQGMVDERYIKNSGDTSYGVGQRLVTARHHVLELSSILTKLISGLRGLVP
jgi:uncharacterized Zn finger protein (UPF0148 family)